MLVYMNFQKDFEAIVIASLKALGSKKVGNCSPYQAFALLQGNRARQVPVNKYKVHFSDDLLDRSDWNNYQNSLADIIDRLERGNSINHCLSKTSANIDHLDQLLSYWGINHLHPVLDGERDGKFPSITAERCGAVLFFRVYGSDIYLIDLLPHPSKSDWINAHLVRVVDRHWPHLHRLYKNATSVTEQLTDDQHKAIWSNGANAFVATERGLVMPAGGLVIGRSSLESMSQWFHITRKLEALQSAVKRHHEALLPRVDGWARCLSLIEVEEGWSDFHVFDGLSQTKVIIRWPG